MIHELKTGLRFLLRELWLCCVAAASQFVIVAAVFYAWVCFGEGQPHRFLNTHEVRPAFTQMMRGLYDKGGCSQ